MQIKAAMRKERKKICEERRSRGKKEHDSTEAEEENEREENMSKKENRTGTEGKELFLDR